jgi:drug/metabolite transporter (DMT)-like permease
VSSRHWTLLILLASLWGASYLFIKIGLEDLPPAAVVFGRTLLAAVVLLPFAAYKGALDGLRQSVRPIALLAGIQVAGPFLLISAGEREISSSLAGILVAAAPIFTALLAIKLDDAERVHGWNLVGIGIGILGVGLLLGLDTGGGSGAIVGGIFVVVASLGYALGGFLLKKRLSERAPVGISGLTMAFSAAMTLPFVLVNPPDAMPDAGSLAAVGALGVFGTGVAFGLFYTMIAQVGPTKASLVAYIAPGFAVIYGVVLRDERFTVATAAGLLLIVGGSYLAAQGAFWRRSPVAVPDVPAGSQQPTPERSAA